MNYIWEDFPIKSITDFTTIRGQDMSKKLLEIFVENQQIGSQTMLEMTRILVPIVLQQQKMQVFHRLVYSQRNNLKPTETA